VDHRAAAAPGTVGIAPHEALGPALVRVGMSGFGVLAAALPPGSDPDEAVHAARKSIKRLRALLRLVRGSVDGAGRKSLDHDLRDIGRRLAPVRDARVTVDTLEGIAPGRCPRLQGLLAGHHRRTLARFLDPDAIAASAAAAAVCRERWEQTMEGVPDAWASIAEGSFRTGRRSAAAMDRAAAAPRGPEADTAFHSWRRQVKYLRHQVEFVVPLDPPRLAVAAADLDRLGELLGSEHDLTVLRGLISDDRCDEAAGVAAAAGERRGSLREAALALGRTTITDDPVGRMAEAWEKGRR
jgi:CHAD domain-containing protein